MKRFNCAALLFAMFMITAAAVCAQGHKVKTFKVNINGNLAVDNSYGDITIKSWDKNEVSVKYEQDEDESEESFAIKVSGNQVRVKSYGHGSNDIEIIIPKRFNIELRTGAGDIKVAGDLYGKLSGSTAGGDIRLGKLSGTVEFLTSGGDISADEMKGEIKIVTYGGDLKLSNIDGNGSVTTSGGDIKMNNIGRDVKVSTAGGNIYVNSVNGKTSLSSGGGDISIGYLNGSADIKTGGGNIKASGGKAYITASTGSGDINMYKIDGAVKASSGSGDMLLEMVNAGQDSYLKTFNGTIKLFLPADIKATVEIKVRGFGKHYSYELSDFITNELKTTGKSIQKNNDNITATYTFNGGGKKIYLDTVNGNIEIKRLK
jgi:hypothetical protein